VSGLVVRRPTTGDAPAALEVARAADVAIFGETDWTEDDLREHWEETDLERDAWLVYANGRLAGWTTFENRGGGRLMGDGYVDPELTGRGVGTRLLGLVEARAGEELDGIEAGVRVHLQNVALHGDGAATRLLESRGYEPIRHFLRLVIDFDDWPQEPEWPDGVRVAGFRTADAVAFHAALEEAFASEWWHRAQPFEEFREKRLARERFDPSLWFVAWDGDEIAGGILGDWKRFDAGWISEVFVRERWRRRGLGLALLRHAFGAFYARGERRCALGVDTRNPTGARRVYERAGMRVLRQADVFEKELRPGR
jgi:mycothiol synthase